MNILYFECNMGAAGDMLMAALWELVDDKEKVLEEINSIGLPNTQISFEKRTTCAITCTKAHVVYNGEEEKQGENHVHKHSHRTLSDVEKIINSLNVSERVKNNAKEIYGIVAAAEAKVHGREVSQVHFHELGMMDAVADITVCAFLIDKINPDKIISSPINVGKGTVKCAHGIMPVPAPATAEILRGVSCYSSQTEGELCTPTGAAILKYYSDDFTSMPVIKTEKIGYGAGEKEFGQANCVRAFYGCADSANNNDVWELVCNIDDMTGEEIGFACEKLFQSGALDVFTQPIYMKKSRPGIMITALCQKEKMDELVTCIFRHTTTTGIRRKFCNRYVMDRYIEERKTPLGNIRVKKSNGYSVDKYKYEYEDLKRVADENDITLNEVKNIAEKSRK